MHTGIPLHAPLFELGLKGYVYGRRAAELAKAADRIGVEHGVTMLFTPQLVDIPLIARETRNLLIVAPHIDPVEVGRGSGSVLPEAVREAGAAGALLNHAENRLTLSHIARAIARADEVGLLTVVCADSAEEAAAVAHLGPSIILAEPPDLIGGEHSVAASRRDFIPQVMNAVRQVSPAIRVLNSAGIRTPQDAAAVIRAGADGTGCTSGVVTAQDPVRMLDAMVAAVKRAWLEIHSGAESSGRLSRSNDGL